MVNKMNFDRMQSLIDRMYSGDIQAIIDGLNHKGCLFRINAIISTFENNVHDDRIIEKLKGLKKDVSALDSIAVGDYAMAVLHLFGIEEYTGNKRYVWNMIDSKMDI